MVLADPAAGRASPSSPTSVSPWPATARSPRPATWSARSPMAPEQAEGRGVGPASGVYSLALTLYEAWTGTNPVRGGGPAATARRVGRPLPSLSGMRRDLPLELCDAIDDALDVDPALRPRRSSCALAAAESELDDEGGLVEPRRCAGRAARDRGRRTAFTRLLRRGRRCAEPRPAAGRHRRAPAALQRRRGAVAGAARRPPRPRRAPGRSCAARARALAGGIVLGVLESLGPDPTFSAAAASARPPWRSRCSRGSRG